MLYYILYMYMTLYMYLMQLMAYTYHKRLQPFGQLLQAVLKTRHILLHIHVSSLSDDLHVHVCS